MMGVTVTKRKREYGERLILLYPINQAEFTESRYVEQIKNPIKKRRLS